MLVSPTNREEQQDDAALSSQQMTVAEVRKSLSAMRKLWEETSKDTSQTPMYISGTALKGTTFSIQEFAFRFVLGHHEKRLSKSRFTSKSIPPPSLPPQNSAGAPTLQAQRGPVKNNGLRGDSGRTARCVAQPRG